MSSFFQTLKKLLLADNGCVNLINPANKDCVKIQTIRSWSLLNSLQDLDTESRGFTRAVAAFHASVLPLVPGWESAGPWPGITGERRSYKLKFGRGTNLLHLNYLNIKRFHFIMAAISNRLIRIRYISEYSVTSELHGGWAFVHVTKLDEMWFQWTSGRTDVRFDDLVATIWTRIEFEIVQIVCWCLCVTKYSCNRCSLCTYLKTISIKSCMRKQ